MTSRQLAEKVAELAAGKKAEEITIMDLRGVTNFADYFVLCTATSDVQLRAVADAILEGLEKIQHKVWHSEGYEARSWILLDCVHVVVHLFLPETRAYYALEKLWGDAPVEMYGT
ncbi:MAG: ribosome silencing factor [Candidatus Latescibacterota bacterium]|nr:MAG: ribosome silencing factor [Candidatus Latescibacterota bacterium]